MVAGQITYVETERVFVAVSKYHYIFCLASHLHYTNKVIPFLMAFPLFPVCVFLPELLL